MRVPNKLAELPVPPGTLPMEARLVDALPHGEEWQFEPKWDGFRCLAFRAGNEVQLQAKSGKPLARYFPEMVALLEDLSQSCFVLDGELTIVADGAFSFDALLARIHPAPSRIQRLARETPANFILFDILVDASGRDLIEVPLRDRRKALQAFFVAAGDHPRLKLSPYTLDRADAEIWLREQGTLDGVIAKLRNGPYLPEERAMLKVKLRRTADCVVGGFRYRTGTQEVGSLLLGLYNEAGKLDHVGFTATISNSDRPALTKELTALSGSSGFTGNAPGGPSRWSTERTSDWVPVQPKLVVEVEYDQVTGHRFRHGTRLLRFRPDKKPRSCTTEQIAPPASVAEVVKEMLAT
jgi:ATP-dependent DNA ligase